MKCYQVLKNVGSMMKVENKLLKKVQVDQVDFLLPWTFLVIKYQTLKNFQIVSMSVSILMQKCFLVVEVVEDENEKVKMLFIKWLLLLKNYTMVL